MTIRKKDLRQLSQILGQEMGMVQAEIERGALAPSTIRPLNMVANRIGSYLKDERIPGFHEGDWFGEISDHKEETLALAKQGAFSTRGV